MQLGCFLRRLRCIWGGFWTVLGGSWSVVGTSWGRYRAIRYVVMIFGPIFNVFLINFKLIFESLFYLCCVLGSLRECTFYRGKTWVREHLRCWNSYEFYWFSLDFSVLFLHVYFYGFGDRFWERKSLKKWSWDLFGPSKSRLEGVLGLSSAVLGASWSSWTHLEPIYTTKMADMSATKTA